MTTTPAGPQPPQLPALGEWQPLPTAGAAPHTAPNSLFDPLVQPAGRDYKKWAIRIVLGLVMAAALGVGTWSIFTLLTDTFHTPKPIALLGCGLFDVAAIFFALLGQSYATTTDSGLAPRLAMFAMVCTSSWVNWKHAELEKWGTVGGVIFASAPVIAELAFEMWHKFEHRATLRALGRVAQTLPVLGKWAWIAHPFRSRKTLDAHIRAALTEHEAVAELREELATERAATILSGGATILERVPAPTPHATFAQIPLTAPERPELGTGSAVERPTVAPATNTTAVAPQGAARRGATGTPWSAITERPLPATADATDPATTLHDDSATHGTATVDEATDPDATITATVAPATKKTDATEATGRGAAKSAILSLYSRHGRRPLESEMVTELKRIRSKHTSRQYANKLRAEIEAQQPHLAALGAENVRALTGTDD
ncbi:DUF2637 domain-containing protein [Streptomyces sp. NPDC015346]|uniref:DUF2637 domain-containing protein n=1 Tax=Streptomyces sp. NPDC015346 TaxID=3364954 RepID=UPI003701DA3E